MSIELRVAEKNEGKSWDRIVEASTYGTIFHTWKWLKIIEKHTKSKLYPIIGLKGSTIIGIYPLFYLKNFFFKSVFSPPPWVSVPFLGPVMVVYDKLKQDKKETLIREFQNKVDGFVKSELKPSYTFISTPPGLLDVRPFKWSGYHVEPAYTYLLDLSNGETHVWEHFKKNLRNDISRTRERDVFVEEGSKEDLAWISKALAKRYVEQGKVASVSREYLRDLYDVFFPQNMKIFAAKYRGETIGGIINIHYKKELLNWLGNTKANIEGISPNDLLHWEAIKWAIKHNLKYYGLIGANTERLCHYKSKFNPSLDIYFDIKKTTKFGLAVEKTYKRLRMKKEKK